MSKCKSPRALQELMTAVDAGNVDIASSDSSKLLQGSRRRRSTYNGRGGAGGVRTRSSPADASFEFSGAASVRTRRALADASFEFSAAAVDNNYSSASPASMVFSNGQLRAHHFPAVPGSSVSSPAGAGRKQPAMLSPVRTSSIGSYSTNKQQASGVTAVRSTKRVSFVTGGVDKAAVVSKAGGGQGKKSGGLIGCCGPSSRNEAVKPVARNHNRKVEAF